MMIDLISSCISFVSSLLLIALIAMLVIGVIIEELFFNRFQKLLNIIWPLIECTVIAMFLLMIIDIVIQKFI